MELPRGTVTFLFTDIEGSTALVKRLRSAYGAVLTAHQELLREAFARHGGREIDTQGDSFFVAFGRATDAVAAAVDAQRALAAHTWPDGVEVRVRMGLHTGEPAAAADRYVGFGVHRAARIGAAAHGGQVLLSNTTRDLAEDELPAEIGIRELGTFRLKDVDRPERLFQLEIDGLTNEFAPLKAEKIAEPHPLRRRAIVLGALAGVIAAAVAIPIFALGQGGLGDESLDAVAGNSVAFVDPDSQQLVSEVEVGTTPTDVAVGAGAVWVTNAADGTVDRIDPETRTVRQTIRVGDGPDGIAFGDGTVWVTNRLSGTVSRIPANANEVTQTISVGNSPSGIAVGEGAVWVVNEDDSTLSKISVETGRDTTTSRVGVRPVDVAVGAGGVWVASAGDGRVLRIDPASGNVVNTVSVGRGPTAITVGAGAVWVANNLDGTVSRIDPESMAVTATIEVGAAPAGIAVGREAVWVASEQEGSLSRIGAAENAVSTISVGGRPAGVAVGADGVFVAARPTAGAHRGGVLTVAGLGVEGLDPAVSFDRVLSITNDGLTAFKRVGGHEGAEIVPNLAISLPDPTDGGRTYSFRVRKGIRYSTGALVRPADFRRALERTFELRGDFAYLYSAIVGASACTRRPRACDLSQGIVADDRAGTVTIRLTEADPELPAKLALPPAYAVPERTPAKDAGRRPLPATGPYRVAAYVPDTQLRLVRNPRFREWSRAAKPDGYPDEIVFTAVSDEERVQVVGRGDADVTDLTLTGEPDVGALRARHGARLRSGPGPAVVYALLNPRLRPFNDVRVRRALSYALDREAIVRAAGGPLVASPSCQVLPANFPAYRRYCPYGRDLGRARRLVAASGTRGARVIVWTRPSYRRFYTHVVTALRRLGYRTRLRVADDGAYYEMLAKEGVQTVQAGSVEWITAYPSAGDFITGLLHFLRSSSGFSDRAVDRQIARARELQQTDPLAANDLWAQIDRMIVDRAPIVPMYNPRFIAFVSARVGNFQYHPLWLTLVDQLWVR